MVSDCGPVMLLPSYICFKISEISAFKIMLIYEEPLLSGRGVMIHIPCNSIRFRLLSFDFDYFDAIM